MSELSIIRAAVQEAVILAATKLKDIRTAKKAFKVREPVQTKKLKKLIAKAAPKASKVTKPKKPRKRKIQASLTFII